MSPAGKVAVCRGLCCLPTWQWSQLGRRESTRRRPALSPNRAEPHQVIPAAGHISQASSAASSVGRSLPCPPRTRSSLQCGSVPTLYCKRYFQLSLLSPTTAGHCLSLTHGENESFLLSLPCSQSTISHFSPLVIPCSTTLSL